LYKKLKQFIKGVVDFSSKLQIKNCISSFAKTKKMKLILCLFVLMAIAYNVKACLEDADCLATECCAATPGAHSVCIAYFEEGEQCSFKFRTPVLIDLFNKFFYFLDFGH
jgi:hypothetical protein